MNIRVQTKLVFLLCSLLVVFFSILLLVRFFANRNIDLLFESRQEEKEVLFDNIIKLKSSSLSAYAYDYTYWDEMVEFVEGKTKDFGEEIIAPSLSTYDSNAVWVYNTDLKLIYSVSNTEKQELKDFPLDKTTLLRIFTHGLFPHFFVDSKAGLLEVDAAPIQPTSDAERKTAPKGFFLTARVWDQEYLKGIESLVSARLKILKTNQSERQVSDFSKGSIVFERDLPSWDNTTVARIQVETDSPSLVSLGKTYNNQLIILVIFGLVVFSLIFVFLFRWIGNPISVLSTSLNKQDPGVLAKLRVDKGSEFASLADLITKFFAQQDELRKEKNLFEKKVVERTAELNKEKEGLSKANEAIGEGYLQLQQEKARLVSSINSLTLGFIMTDLKNEVFIANRSAAKILEIQKPILTMSDIKGKIGKLVDLDRYIEKAKKEKVPQEVKEVSFGNKFLHLFFSPIILLKDKEEYIGAVVLLEDITEAKILDRSKDEFFSIASHELRTPLTAIRGNTSLIRDFYRDKIKDKELAEMIDDIHDSSIRLIKIVNDFLDTSRLEQKRMEFKKDKFKILDLIKEVNKEIAANAEQKKISLTVKDSADNTEVVADRDRSKQVLFNLIGNAIKYTDKGGVEVEINKTSGFAKISVTDSGKGVPAANQSLLFRKFQQAANSILTRDGVGGTGLGLYISKLMVEGMGGSIQLEKSVENKGSVFSFTLPTAKQS
ncbi:MAG: ATP-binding protein [bacterium]|nr:ATP-binding protein [bacterium]